MKKLRKISKVYYLRQIVACWLVSFMAFGIPAQVAMAGPPIPTPIPDLTAGPHGFAVGTGSVLQGANGNAWTNVTVQTQESIIHWQTINTLTGEDLNYLQNGVSGAAVLNRVVGGDGGLAKTLFDGNLNADSGMKIFMVNPAGIVFGSTATINVTQLVASSLDIDNDDFINGLPYTFTGGANGARVINYSTDFNADRIALISEVVVNRGSLVSDAPDGYVIMAAGETVTISENSPVSVVVTMPDHIPGDYDYYVDNGVGPHSPPGGGNIEADHVILAAGDIWSAAIDNVETLRAEAKGSVVFDGDILAQAGAGSEAEADVTIISGGDLVVDYDITAEATGDGVFDATASINLTSTGGSVEVKSDGYHSTTIKAKAKDGLHNYADVLITATDGDVSVSAKDGDVRIKAEADPEDFDPVLNVANIEITGENVNIVSEDSGGILDILSPDDALIYAYAHDADENKSSILITADGLDESGNVTIESIGQKGDDVLVKAEAKNSNVNTATVGISAAGNVDIKAYGLFDEALVKAEAWNDIELDPEIVIETILVQEAYVDGDILIPAVYEDVADPVDETIQGLTNTAWVAIRADEHVNIKGEGSGDAAVKALAHNEIEVDIHNADTEVTVDLTVADLENWAGVTITAEGEGGVYVGANGTSSKVGIAAEAYNELEFDQHTGGKEWIPDPDAQWWEFWKGELVDLEAYAAALNLDVTGLVNRSDIGIKATNGNVGVGSDEDWFGTVAKIGAKAYNDFDIDLYTKDQTNSTGNLTLDGLTNNAGIDVAAGYDVSVIAGNGGESGIFTEAFNVLEGDSEAEGTITVDNIINISDVDITATYGAVAVTARCEDDTSDAYIYADAYDDTPKPDNEPENIANNATVDVTAGENVEVTASDGGVASISSWAEHGVDNTASVTINTEDGDVLVKAVQADASIVADAREGDDNTATVNINVVGGDVVVRDTGGGSGGGGATSKIVAWAQYAENSNNADVQITATPDTTTYEEDDGQVYTKVHGGNVLVEAKDGGHAEITAFAADAEAATNHVPNNHVLGVGPLPEVDPTSNTANVMIRTTSAEGTRREIVKEAVKEGDRIIEPAVYGAVAYTEGGDVEVIGENGGEAVIQAVTMRANENDSDVLICAEGEVVVSDKNSQVFTAKIKSVAHFGNINNAYTGVRGAEGITVLADSGNASIASEAMFGLYGEMPAEQNTAFTSLCTDGDVLVIGLNYGIAEVLALADYGYINDAAVGVCADGDILVAAGLGTMGGTAKIKAEARAGLYEYYVPADNGDGDGDRDGGGDWILTSSTANTTVVSHKGGVGVIDVGGPTTALIEAEAYESGKNNAYVGVAAGADLSPSDLVEPVTNDYEMSPVDELLEYILPGNVNVEGRESSAKAYILAQAYDGFENIAETVVCAPGEVIVYAYGHGMPIAQIKSRAGWHGDEDSLNDATTRIYASEVLVDVPGLYRGNGVWAYAAGIDQENPRVPGTFLLDLGYLSVPYTGDYYDMTEHGEVVYGDGEEDNATLIIQNYSKRENCPECPPCPDCEEKETPLEIAPALVQLPLDIPLIMRGCPVVIEAAANELGITQGTIQVSIGNALALNPTLQACDACATLIDAAAILRDEDGSRMAAMTQMFNDMAPGDAPYTPEMQALIATAFAGAAEGSQYATVMEYTDAFVQYFSVLETDLASPVGDSLAFVMDKYGAGVLGSDNSNIAAFVATRLESGETFGN